MASRRLSVRQRERFLEHFAETLNVSAAAKAAACGRSTVYRLRAEDAGFAEAWAQAEGEAVDRLEGVALEIATRGALEERFDASGRLVESRRRQDPQMVRFLLSAHRPDTYSEKQRLELAARVQVEALPPPVAIAWSDVLELAQGRRELGEGPPAGEVVDVEEEVEGDG